ncbi:hypothetical protein D3C87_1026160 [compost metagenome]
MIMYIKYKMSDIEDCLGITDCYFCQLNCNQDYMYDLVKDRCWSRIQANGTKFYGSTICPVKPQWITPAVLYISFYIFCLTAFVVWRLIEKCMAKNLDMICKSCGDKHHIKQCNELKSSKVCSCGHICHIDQVCDNYVSVDSKQSLLSTNGYIPNYESFGKRIELCSCFTCNCDDCNGIVTRCSCINCNCDLCLYSWRVTILRSIFLISYCIGGSVIHGYLMPAKPFYLIASIMKINLLDSFKTKEDVASFSTILILISMFCHIILSIVYLMIDCYRYRKKNM